MEYYFTSDEHYFHKNIIKYANRPFSSVQEMNNELIERFNSVVSKSDITIHGGDFSFGDIKQTNNIIKRLNGDHIFIRGDHDRPLAKIRKLKSVYKINIYKQKITICHYAMRVWHCSHYNSWHLYGHSHGKLPGQGKSMDIGVDTNDYYPYSFDDIKIIMNSKPDNFNLIKR